MDTNAVKLERDSWEHPAGAGNWGLIITKVEREREGKRKGEREGVRGRKEGDRKGGRE